MGGNWLLQSPADEYRFLLLRTFFSTRLYDNDYMVYMYLSMTAIDTPDMVKIWKRWNQQPPNHSCVEANKGETQERMTDMLLDFWQDKEWRKKKWKTTLVLVVVVVVVHSPLYVNGEINQFSPSLSTHFGGNTEYALYLSYLFILYTYSWQLTIIHNDYLLLLLVLNS
jgi:hypothetical protein